MNQYIHTSTNQKQDRLLLFFAGWGMDERPFIQYTPRESDFMICYDYHTLDFDTSPTARYSHIDVVAWSMGIWAASQVLSRIALPVNSSVAINGTPFPIDEKRGIPPAIFEGTLEGLNEVSLRKFQRRMCANGSAFDSFRHITPQRSAEDLKEELAAIARQYRELPPASFSWKKAIMGENDRIFPPANQHTAWEETSASILHGNEAHYDESLFTQYLK